MTLKDAVNETMREWTRRIANTHYARSVMGPHPFRQGGTSQSVIGREIKEELQKA